MRETWVRYLGWDDPLEESMATHSSILDWRIPWTKEPGELQSLGSQRDRHDLAGVHVPSIAFLTYWFLSSKKESLLYHWRSKMVVVVWLTPVTKYHKCSGLKQHRFHILQFGDPISEMGLTGLKLRGS